MHYAHIMVATLVLIQIPAIWAVQGKIEVPSAGFAYTPPKGWTVRRFKESSYLVAFTKPEDGFGYAQERAQFPDLHAVLGDTTPWHARAAFFVS